MTSLIKFLFWLDDSNAIHYRCINCLRAQRQTTLNIIGAVYNFACVVFVCWNCFHLLCVINTTTARFSDQGHSILALEHNIQCGCWHTEWTRFTHTHNLSNIQNCRKWILLLEMSFVWSASFLCSVHNTRLQCFVVDIRGWDDLRNRATQKGLPMHIIYWRIVVSSANYLLVANKC